MLGIAVSLVMAAAARAADDGQKPDERDQTTKHAFAALRKACATEAAFRGILIKDASADKGVLRLKGFVDREEQKKLLENEADRLLGDVPGWKEKYPRRLSAADLAVLPVREKFLKSVQQHFAANTRANGHERAILRATRLDDAYFDDGDEKTDTLVLTGACIYLGMPAPPLDFDAAAPLMPTTPAPDVKVVISTAARDYLRDEFLAKGAVTEAAKKLIPEVGVKPLLVLKGNDNPIVLLQNKLVTEGGRDDVLCTARYDGEGALQVEGVAASRERLQEIDAVLREQPAKYTAFRPAGDKANPRWSTAGVKVRDWPLSRARLQRGLALDKSPALQRQTRLDRVYLTYSEDDRGLLTLWFDGVSCHSDLDKQKAALAADLLARCAADVPNLESYLNNRASVKGVVSIGQPRFVLQKAIAAERALDGTLIDLGAYFDAEGNMSLRGLWVGPGVRRALKTLAEKALDQEYKQHNWPLLNGRLAIHDEDMRPSHVGEMLAQLRQHAEENLEDFWLDRLYFDATFKLILSGFGPAGAGAAAGAEEEEADDPAPAAADDLTRRLKEMMKSHPELEGTATGAALKGVGVTPAAYLRARVQKPDDPTWDGILLERGYYRSDGVYSMAGIVDGDGQLKQLDVLLKRFADNKEGAPLFPAPDGQKKWALTGLDVIPLKPMFQCLRRVMPAYEVFDGLWLERAYYDGQKRLVFLGTAVGEKPGRAADARLKQLFDDARPEWQRRTASGVLLSGLKQVPQDFDVAEKALQAALREVGAGMEELAPAYHADRGPCPLGPGCAACLLTPEGSERVPRRTREQVRAAALKRFGAAVPYFDVALLHTPDNTTAWYLRALCYVAQGDGVLAQRDLVRAVKFEKAQPGFRETRLVKTEYFQGEYRADTTRLMENLYLDPSSFKAPLSLKDCP
jgi:hypothetical protein